MYDKNYFSFKEFISTVRQYLLIQLAEIFQSNLNELYENNLCLSLDNLDWNIADVIFC